MFRNKLFFSLTLTHLTLVTKRKFAEDTIMFAKKIVLFWPELDLVFYVTDPQNNH